MNVNSVIFNQGCVVGEAITRRGGQLHAVRSDWVI